MCGFRIVLIYNELDSGYVWVYVGTKKKWLRKKKGRRGKIIN